MFSMMHPRRFPSVARRSGCGFSQKVCRRGGWPVARERMHGMRPRAAGCFGEQDVGDGVTGYSKTLIAATAGQARNESPDGWLRRSPVTAGGVRGRFTPSPAPCF